MNQVQSRIEFFVTMVLSVSLIVYSVLILAASMTGGYLPMLMRLTHARAQMMMTFVAGLMLGVSLFIMLPHGVMATGSVDTSVLWMTVGLLFMFFMLRTFHFHQHGPQATTPETNLTDAEELKVLNSGDHDHDHDHDHGHLHGVGHTGCGHAEHVHDGQHSLSWLGVGLGLAVHSMLDGIALGASVKSDLGHASTLLPGFATFLAIVLHKPLDAMAITTLMAAGGWKTGWRQVVNALFGLMCPAGVMLFLMSVGRLHSHEGLVVGSVLAFSAGIFLCIAVGDLMPEIQLHSHDRFKLSGLLVLGVLTAYLTGLVERQGHSHAPHGDEVEKSSATESHDHGNDHGHGHHESH